MKISLVMAVRNGEGTIRAAVNSVLQQNYECWELVVVDGCSTDATLEVLSAYSDNRIKVTSEVDSGIYDALNKGVRRATGDVIGFLHSDDELAHPDTLGKIASAFQNQSVDACYGDLQYVSRRDPSRVIRRWVAGNFAEWKLRFGWMPPHPTFYAKYSLYDKLGGFDESYRIASDYEITLRFLSRAIDVAYIPDFLVRMKVGGVSNRSMLSIATKSKEDLKIAKKYFGFLGWLAVVSKNIRKLPQFL